MSKGKPKSVVLGFLLAAVGTVLFLLTVVYGLNRVGAAGPYTLNELPDVPLPAYHLPDDRQALDTAYFYYETDGMVYLETYFVDAYALVAEEEASRYGKLLTSQGPFAERLDPLDNNAIRRAAPDSVYTCSLLAVTARVEPIGGTRYQTCLTWQEEAGVHQTFYSTWPLDEALDLVNSLQRP